MATNYDGTQSGENFNLIITLNALGVDYQQFDTDVTGRGAKQPQIQTFQEYLISTLPNEVHPR